MAMKIVQELPGDLKDCKATTDDVQRLESWAKSFENPVSALKIIVTNMYEHFGDVTEDISHARSDIACGQWNQGGLDLADLLIEVLGVVPELPGPDGLKITQW